MEREDITLICILVTVFLASALGLYYIGQKIGHDKAYKELYAALSEQTQDIYYQGLSDGLRRCDNGKEDKRI